MMIGIIAAIYSALALFFVKQRLNLAREELKKKYESCWNYPLPLRGGYAIRFFPYTILLGEKTKTYIDGLIVSGWKPPEVMDPVNIIAYGVPRNEFIKLLRKSNIRWKQFIGTCQFLHADNSWHASVPIKIDIDKKRGERYHIRLFEVKTRKNKTLTLCAAHRDNPKNAQGEHPAPKSFNEPRDIVMQDFLAINLETYLIGQITERGFRGAESDGKILFIACD